MKIMQSVKKVPGGMMIIPLILGVLMNTIWPEFFDYFKGTFTTHLWKTGAMPILAVFLFCNGTTISLKEAGTTVYKGCVLTAVKVLVGIACGLFVGRVFGEAGFMGVTSMRQMWAAYPSWR